MSTRLKRILWDLWIPDYEGGGPWHLRWRACLMLWVRRAWYLGKQSRCVCEPCMEMVSAASASGMCRDCLNEDCQHEVDS